MTEDELKNKISMALKDPTLQQGFEIICKELKELEKENAELQHKVDILQGFLDRDVEFDNLQKENAELKDYRLTTLAKQQTDMSKYALNLEHKLSWYDDQLTKAKEILKAVVDFYPTTTATILCEAEKFISEVEK